MMKLFMKKRKKNQKGFTLVELVVVIAILAILAAIAVPQLLGFQERARQQADRQMAAQIKNALALLYANGEALVRATNNVTFVITGKDINGFTITGLEATDLYTDTNGNGIWDNVAGASDVAVDETELERLLVGTGGLVGGYALQSAGSEINVIITPTGGVTAVFGRS